MMTAPERVLTNRILDVEKALKGFQAHIDEVMRYGETNQGVIDSFNKLCKFYENAHKDRVREYELLLNKPYKP